LQKQNLFNRFNLITMTAEELKALQDKVGAEAAAAMKRELEAYEVRMKAFATQIAEQKGGITKEQFDEYKIAATTAVDAIKAIAEKQGTTLAEIAVKLGKNEVGTKSIREVLETDKEDLRKLYSAGSGQKTYMVNVNEKGLYVMTPFDATKTTGAEASIANIPAGAVASITQALDAATLLRIGAGALINGQYRNSAWVFELCNTVNASFNSSMPFAIWFDEQPKVGASATVLEGGVKPSTQYLYQLNSQPYKKEATLVGFTQEFQMDFAQLESDIMNKSRVDVINRVNQAILPNIITAATAYNTAASFQQGTVVPSVNDFDAIAAMAAQVDNATFGARANTAVMSTFKKYRMGIQKNTQGSYLNAPDVLNGIGFVGNASMAADDVLVGDLKQYNIILRGGLIVRVGYNGTDFAQNMYSVVLEQFYFDYISTVRKPAIVKGPDFATVKALIAA
jgi:hypothetical protein